MEVPQVDGKRAKEDDPLAPSPSPPPLPFALLHWRHPPSSSSPAQPSTLRCSTSTPPCVVQLGKSRVVGPCCGVAVGCFLRRLLVVVCLNALQCPPSSSPGGCPSVGNLSCSRCCVSIGSLVGARMGEREKAFQPSIAKLLAIPTSLHVGTTAHTTPCTHPTTTTILIKHNQPQHALYSQSKRPLQRTALLVCRARELHTYSYSQLSVLIV